MAVPKSLNEALLAFQKDPLSLEKDSTNPAFGRGSKYISLDAALPKIIEKLNALGIVVVQPPSHIEGAPALRTLLTHVASGDTLETVMPLILDKDTAQGQGSAITYAKRYAILSILGLVAETDDDGNAASKNEVEVVNRPRTRQTAAQKKAETKVVSIEGNDAGGW
jgi:hypothetical protein